MDRREALLAAVAGLTGASLGDRALATASGIEARPAKNALPTWVRLNASLSGGPIYAYTAGTVFGFKPQSDQTTLADFGKRIYGYQSLVVRKARPLAGGAVAVKSQSWTFYTDPLTDDVTTTLHNPYTGEDVASTPMAPKAREQVYGVDGRVVPERGPGVAAEELAQQNPFDMRIRHIGAHSWVDTTQFTRFQTPGISWFKLEAQMMSYACARADLEDASADHIPSTWSHNLVAEWQTWMKMHGAPGHILFKGEGTNIPSARAAPGSYLTALEQYFPGALTELDAW